VAMFAFEYHPTAASAGMGVADEVTPSQQTSSVTAMSDRKRSRFPCDTDVPSRAAVSLAPPGLGRLSAAPSPVWAVRLVVRWMLSAVYDR
jgi:hypothetical protein